MKKNIAIAALAAALLLTGCSNGNSSASEQSSSSASESASTAEAELKTAAEKADAVLANITFSGEMVAVDTDTIDVRFGFSADGISDYAAYICGSGAYPDEFGVFTADSAEKADEIKTALEKRAAASLENASISACIFSRLSSQSFFRFRLGFGDFFSSSFSHLE